VVAGDDKPAGISTTVIGIATFGTG